MQTPTRLLSTLPMIEWMMGVEKKAKPTPSTHSTVMMYQ